MVLSGWWEASNDTVSVAILSEQFVKDNPDVVKNTHAVDGEISGVTLSEVVLKDKTNIQEQMDSFVYSIGGNPEDMSADNFILSVENQMGKAMISSESILFAVVFVLMFVLCGYLLIYNIFDISVMQDVRQYGLLRMIGTSTRQIKSIVNRQAVSVIICRIRFAPRVHAFQFFLHLFIKPGGRLRPSESRICICPQRIESCQCKLFVAAF